MNNLDHNEVIMAAWKILYIFGWESYSSVLFSQERLSNKLVNNIEIQKPVKTSRSQRGNTKQILYSGPINIRHYSKKNFVTTEMWLLWLVYSYISKW
jgi:hypothetical protein